MSFPKQSRSSCSRYGLFVVLCLATVAGSLQAQLGTAWEEYRADCDLHLGNQAAEKRQRCLDADSSLEEALGSPATAAYASDAGQKKERFTLGAPGERAKVREKNNYLTGSRQFEGWVTVRAPIERQMIFQIWGSGEQDRATQFFLRGYHEDGGTLRAFVAGSPSIRVAKWCYDGEVRTTVIHLQEDEGGRILLYLDGKRVHDVPDVFPASTTTPKVNTTSTDVMARSKGSTAPPVQSGETSTTSRAATRRKTERLEAPIQRSTMAHRKQRLHSLLKCSKG